MILTYTSGGTVVVTLVAEPPPEDETNAISEIEFDVMSLEPPTLFAEDPDSYWGGVRHIFSSHKQAQLVDPISTWSINRFVDSVNIDDIGRWESMFGLPANTALELAVRRAAVLSHMNYQPFTYKRRRDLVESYMVIPAGNPAALVPEGIALDAGGIPLYAEGGPDATTFRIYEDVMRFVYVVRVNSGSGADTVALLRDLLAITPAHIGVTLSSVANVLDYKLQILDGSPAWYSRFGGNANDETGYANNGALTDAPTNLTSPGLLDAAVGNAGYTFNGSADYITIPAAAQLQTPRTITLEAWSKPGTAGYGAATYGHIFSTPGLKLGALNNQYVLGLTIDGNYTELLAPAASFGSAVTRMVQGRYDGSAMSIWIDGVKAAELAITGPLSLGTASWMIGRNQAASNGFWNGSIDEPAIYGQALSDEQLYTNYRTGKNLLN